MQLTHLWTREAGGWCRLSESDVDVALTQNKIAIDIYFKNYFADPVTLTFYLFYWPTNTHCVAEKDVISSKNILT